MLPKLKEIPNLKNIICLIKPQFECGPEVSARYHGVIRNIDVHKSVIQNVVKSFVILIAYSLFNITFFPKITFNVTRKRRFCNLY